MSFLIIRRLLHLVSRSCKFLPKSNSYNFKKFVHITNLSTRSKFLTSTFLLQIAYLKKSNPMDKVNNEMKDILSEADRLYKERKFENILSLLQAYSTYQNEEVIWRVARATYEISQQKKNKNEQLQELEKAFALIERAMQINNQNGYVHKWYAILLNSILSHKGVKAKINGGNAIKEHLETAIKYIPNDPTCHYLLGYWCYTVADLTWYERKIASLIYATPPTNSYEEALVHFERAEKIQPLFYNMNLLMLGKCYLKTKQHGKAKEALTKAGDFLTITPGDENVRLIQLTYNAIKEKLIIILLLDSSRSVGSFKTA